MSTNVDLRQLARRGTDLAPRPPARRTPWLTRYVLPAAVLLGFAAVAVWAARDSLLPSHPVTVVPVLTTHAAVRQGGAPLFQAAGWVEPRPTPVLATALAEGVVERLLVVEGQEVQGGEPVAQLVEADARLVVRAAEADLRHAEAERERAAAALEAARVNVDQPVQLEAAAAEADAMLAQKQAELSELPSQRSAAETRLRVLRGNYDAAKEVNKGSPEPLVSLRHAAAEVDTAAAAVDQLTAREPHLKREVEALKAKSAALRKRLELKTEEARQLADAAAGVHVAEARVEQARTALDAARLRLERMTVRAPSGGRVLALVARPGTRLMGLAPASAQDASTVVSLYDPAALQVRADVLLENVPQVHPGQAVRIETPAVPGGLDGAVLQATSLADVQKNTLQVKVAVTAPPSVLKPDMLVRATFLADAAPEGPADAESLRLLIPRGLVQSGDGGARVWLADQAAGVARLRAVKLGGEAGDLVEVVEGLNASDKLIAGGRDGLYEGRRMAVTGEEAPDAPGRPSEAKHDRPQRLPPADGGNGGKH
jgi:multidrug efflux pump subunit AcrA (membrane-fusion protein)